MTRICHAVAHEARHLDTLMDDVRDVLLVSNTPAYLYKNLRRVLRDMADVIPFDDVASALYRELEAPRYDIHHQLPYVYALFILMTYGRYEDVRKHIPWIRSKNVPWMGYLIRYYENNSVDFISQEHSFRNPLISSTATVLDGSGSTLDTGEIHIQ